MTPVLRCPYPNCPGTFEDKPDSPNLLICPDAKCQRPAARCTARLRGVRCRGLNRPVARFCRVCRQVLEPDWARDAWLRDLLARPAESAGRLELDAAEPVVCLEDDPGRAHGDRTVIELGETAGRVWLGIGEGWLLLVDPFARGQPPLLARQLWLGDGNLRVRARSAGVWLVVYCEMGVSVLDLLRVDDRRPGFQQPVPYPLWDGQDEQRLVAEPVLLRCRPGAPDTVEGMDRVAVWATTGARGLTLWTARLSLSDQSPPPVEQIPLKPVPAGPEGRVELVAASFGGRDGAVLCLPGGLIRLDLEVPDGPSNQAIKLKTHPLADATHLAPEVSHFTTGSLERGGLVFVPESPGHASSAGGTIWVAGRHDGRSSRETLYRVATGAPPHVDAFPDAGLPLGVESFSGNQRVLCLTRHETGHALRLYNALGQVTMRADNQYLAHLQRAHVAGRLAVCSGMDVSPSGSRWFTLLADLARDDWVFGLKVQNYPLPHPVLLGRNLFTVDWLPRAGHGGAAGRALHLVRHRIRDGAASSSVA